MKIKDIEKLLAALVTTVVAIIMVGLTAMFFLAWTGGGTP
jgi:hypothetical protein